MKSRFRSNLDSEGIESVVADVSSVEIQEIMVGGVKIKVPRFSATQHKPKWWPGSIVTEPVDFDTRVVWSLTTGLTSVFDGTNPETDGVEVGPDNVVMKMGRWYFDSWYPPDSNYDVTLVPSSGVDLTTDWEITGSAEYTVDPLYGAPESYAPMNDAYIGVGDPSTDFVGIKFHHETWFDGISTKGLYVLVQLYRVVGGSATSTTILEQNYENGAIPSLSGYLTFRRVGNTYTVSTNLGGSAVEYSITSTQDLPIRLKNQNTELEMDLVATLTWSSLEYHKL